MKVGLTTALSIAGVLAAGTAAFAVNSSVLSTTPSSQSAIVESSVSQGVDAVTTNPGQVGEQSINVQSSVLSNNATTYQVGTSGSVVIDMNSGALAVSNVLPAVGWSSVPALVQSNGDVKVYFTSSRTQIEFLARLVDGKVSVSVTSQPIVLFKKPAITDPTKPSVPFSDDDEDGEHGGGDKDDD